MKEGNTIRVVDLRDRGIQLGACVKGKWCIFVGSGRSVTLMLDITTTWSSWSLLDRGRVFGVVTTRMIVLFIWVSFFRLF